MVFGALFFETHQTVTVLLSAKGCHARHARPANAEEKLKKRPGLRQNRMRRRGRKPGEANAEEKLKTRTGLRPNRMRRRGSKPRAGKVTRGQSGVRVEGSGKGKATVKTVSDFPSRAGTSLTTLSLDGNN
jgi:hypothetical protein